MNYQSELQFLCDTLRKNRVQVLVCTPAELVAEAALSGRLTAEPLPFDRFPNDIERHTMYILKNEFDLHYRYFLLPDTPLPTMLLVGPYLIAAPFPERLLELGERRGISPSLQARFEEHYQTIPVLADGNPLFVMLTTFCERVWNTHSFAIVDVNAPQRQTVSPIYGAEPPHVDDLLVHMKTMEERYAFENELIRAVSLGQLHAEERLLSAFAGQQFEKRNPDPLRNAKNYCIIMNTLLRKAAENGGVHPVYIDRLSSEIAAKIESLSDLGDTSSLMRDIFRSYCRLVRHHSLAPLSPVVQKAVLRIDSDLSADLSLQALADTLGVSAGYLSAAFKRDTGQTLTAFVRDRRMRHAKHLLATTHLQVQTVALHCGIMDVQYFSKIFKKATGQTPKAYRESRQTT